MFGNDEGFEMFVLVPVVLWKIRKNPCFVMQYLFTNYNIVNCTAVLTVMVRVIWDLRIFFGIIEIYAYLVVTSKNITILAPNPTHLE
jgi:hypothetical protein